MTLEVNNLIGFGAGAVELTPSYRATYINTADLSTYTFSAADLGVPDASRMVVVCVVDISGGTTGVTVDGTAATLVASYSEGPAVNGSMWRAASTANPTGDIVVTTDTATMCVISVYALYPSSQTPVDAVAVSNGNASSSLVALDVAKTLNGFTIIAGHSRDNSGTWIVTQTGAETIIENYDAVTETAGVFAASHVNTATTTLDDYTATPSVADEKGMIVASWF